MLMKIGAVINLFAGLVMVGLAIILPIIHGTSNLGWTIGIVVGLGGGGLVCLAVGVFLWIFSGKFGKNPLLTTGIPATAVIKTVQETGITLQKGMFIILNFTLEVGPGTPNPYQVACRSMVPRIALANVGVGRLVAVRVDPQNANKVAIDWNGVPA